MSETKVAPVAEGIEHLVQGRKIEIFSTCPPSSHYSDADYREMVGRIARWSDRAGCTGILVYTDNRLLDPWLVSQIVIENSEQLSPLVAIEPIYMHPYTVAKMVVSLAFLHRRRLFLNMVAGGFRNDLVALGDPTPHDKRYQRLVEYTTIVTRLLEGEAPVTLAGEFYRVERLKMTPELPRDLRPGVFVSGSSEAGMTAARALGAVAVKYPKPASEDEGFTESGVRKGIRVGIISRATDAEAWRVAHERFPGDRRGELTHELASKTSDSVWHRELSEAAARERSDPGPYWLFPFQNYKTFCPYLVGSYETVGFELSRFLAQGVDAVILDVPASEEELWHTHQAFRTAAADVP